jgi:DNA-binding GntR family transcriptional regulator
VTETAATDPADGRERRGGPSRAAHGPSAADALAAALRARILDGELPGGARLREQELAGAHDVARHTVRAALRALQAEGLVVIEAHRGARVAFLGPGEVQGLYELRQVLETGAVRLALQRGGGRLPAAVHARAAAFAALCRRRPAPPWREVVAEHDLLHRALVGAAGSERIARAHASLSAELQLFLVQGRPAFPLEQLAADHLALVAGIDAEGLPALERHLAQSAAQVGAIARDAGGR